MQIHVHEDPGWQTNNWPVMFRFSYNDCLKIYMYAYASVDFYKSQCFCHLLRSHHAGTVCTLKYGGYYNV